jgi:hypothetical protein
MCWNFILNFVKKIYLEILCQEYDFKFAINNVRATELI